MKKILLFSVLLAGAALFAGCAGEEENLFDKSAAERLNEISKTYTQRLEASPGGWVMEYYPTNDTEGFGGQGYLLMARFNPDHSVTMGMNNELSLNQYLEDTTPWEVITDNGPVLSFNSYNECMHTFSDPEAYIRGIAVGDQGTGVGGDYEFVMVDVPEDGEFVMLKGKKRGTYTRMTKVPADTKLDVYLMEVKLLQTLLFPSSFNPVLFTMGDKRFRMIQGNTTVPNIYKFDGDSIADESRHPFLMTMRDSELYLRFREPFEIGKDSTVQEFVLKEGNLVGVDAKGVEASITGFPKGLFFNEYITYLSQYTSGKGANVAPAAKMSDKMLGIFNRITNSLSARKVTFRGLKLVLDKDGVLTWRLQYRAGTGNAATNYVYDWSTTDEDVTFAYKETNAAGTQMMSLYDGVSDLVNALGQKFNFRASLTNFDLRTMRLVAADDPDMWFEITWEN